MKNFYRKKVNYLTLLINWKKEIFSVNEKSEMMDIDETINIHNKVNKNEKIKITDIKEENSQKKNAKKLIKYSSQNILLFTKNGRQKNNGS